MLTDGLRLIEGSGSTNLVLPSGSTFPNQPNTGEIFVNLDALARGVYVYDGTQWVNISAIDAGSGAGSFNIDWSTIINTPTTIEGYNITGGTFTGDVTLSTGAYLIINDPPQNDTDVATKTYVDARVNGLSWKQSVKVATTGNITLSGLQTIDGYALSSGDRVLVMNQNTPAQNGIYIVSSGGWSRAADFDSLSPLDEINGAAVYVQNGTINQDLSYTVTSSVSNINVDPITWVILSGFSVNSPHLTGVPTAPTATAGTNTTQIATTEYVDRMNFYDLSGFFPGKPGNSEIMWRFVSVRNLTLPAGLTGSVSKSGTAATGSTVLTLKKNGTAVGTITFAASGTVGSFAAASTISLVSGDVLTISNQATADATLSDIDFTLVASLA